jgi:hypothetical protein
MMVLCGPLLRSKNTVLPSGVKATVSSLSGWMMPSSVIGASAAIDAVLADACDEAKQRTTAARQNEQAMAGMRLMGHDFSSDVSNRSFFARCRSARRDPVFRVSVAGND